jgi:phage baseplate assembly protein gpV
MYENCVLMNLFGGFADKLTYTLRAEKTAGRKDSRRQPGEPGKGAKVLLLCANGESHSPIIIGGLREAATDKDPKDEKEKGHNLFFEFNGVAFEISHDGEVTLTVKGSTDEAGKPTKDVATDKLPSVVKIGKDGKITAQTKEGKNSIVIEQSGKVTVTSEKEVVVNTKKATITATDKCSVIAKIIELGGEGIGGLPPQGVVLGSHVDTFTGAPFFALGATSNTVFAKK